MRAAGLIGVVLVVLTACRSETPKQAGLEHRDAILGYALALPAGWSVAAENTGMVLVSLRRGVSDTLSVSAQRVARGTTLEVFDASERATLSQAGMQIRPAERVTLGGKPGIAMTGVVPEAGRPKHMRRYTVLRDDIVVTFEIMGAASDQASWHTAIAEFEAAVQWLPGRPTMPKRRIAHPDAQGGGWQIANNIWSSAILDLQMDISPYASLMAAPDLPLGTFLLARDLDAPLQLEVYATPAAAPGTTLLTLAELYGAAAQAAPVTLNLLGKPTPFTPFESEMGHVLVARIARPSQMVDLVVMTREAPDISALQAMLDRLKVAPSVAAQPARAKARAPWAVEGDLMFDGTALRDRRAGLKWALGPGEWQVKIGQAAAAVHDRARFMAFDARTGITHALYEYSDQTPEDWRRVTAQVYANATAQAPHSMAGQTVPVWHMPGGALSMAFTHADRRFITESVSSRARLDAPSAATRAVLSGVGPIEAGWGVTRMVDRFHEPWFGLKVQLPPGLHVRPAENPPHLSAAEFMQFYGTAAMPKGFVRTVATPHRAEAIEMLSALVAQVFTATKIARGEPQLVPFGRAQLKVWAGQGAGFPAVQMRLGVTYAKGVGLVLSHMGPESEWKALLAGIEFMPE